MKLSIVINHDTILNWDTTKFPLLSFCGMALQRAFLNSSKELSEPLTIQINGKAYQFKDKLINVKYEALPVRLNSSFLDTTNEAEKILIKQNFIGFILTSLFVGCRDYSKLNLHKNAVMNKQLQSSTNLNTFVTALIEPYKSYKVQQANEIKAVKIELISNGLINLEAYKKAKELNINLKNLMQGRLLESEATKRNNATKQSRATKRNNATKQSRATKQSKATTKEVTTKVQTVTEKN